MPDDGAPSLLLLSAPLFAAASGLAVAGSSADDFVFEQTDMKAFWDRQQDLVATRGLFESRSRRIRCSTTFLSSAETIAGAHSFTKISAPFSLNSSALAWRPSSRARFSSSPFARA